MARTGGVEAAEPTAEEKANVKVVVDFCKAWEAHDLARLTPFIGDECAIRWSEKGQWITGREAVIVRIKQLLDTSERVELEVVETYPKGPLVLNERFDRTTRQGKVNGHRLSGIFYVKAGKILEWSDYAM
jgi:limonene-1,2-epoxide hydrolase